MSYCLTILQHILPITVGGAGGGAGTVRELHDAEQTEGLGRP